MPRIIKLTDINEQASINDLYAVKVNLTTYNAGINQVNTDISNLKDDLDQQIIDTKAYADSLVQDLKDGDIKALQDAVTLLNSDSSTEGSVDYKISTAIAALVDGAPEQLDTLKEIVDFIESAEVDIEGLIDAINDSITALIDNASDDYNTLGKIEARVKEVIAQHATDVATLNDSINTVLMSIPVHANENSAALDTDNYTFQTGYVVYGMIYGGTVDLYYEDADGNLVIIGTFTAHLDTDDDSGKTWIVDVDDQTKEDYADELSQAKVIVDYDWRQIDNQ